MSINMYFSRQKGREKYTFYFLSINLKLLLNFINMPRNMSLNLHLILIFLSAWNLYRQLLLIPCADAPKKIKIKCIMQYFINYRKLEISQYQNVIFQINHKRYEKNLSYIIVYYKKIYKF